MRYLPFLYRAKVEVEHSGHSLPLKYSMQPLLKRKRGSQTPLQPTTSSTPPLLPVFLSFHSPPIKLWLHFQIHHQDPHLLVPTALFRSHCCHTDQSDVSNTYIGIKEELYPLELASVNLSKSTVRSQSFLEINSALLKPSLYHPAGHLHCLSLGYLFHCSARKKTANPTITSKKHTHTPTHNVQV